MLQLRHHNVLCWHSEERVSPALSIEGNAAEGIHSNDSWSMSSCDNVCEDDASTHTQADVVLRLRGLPFQAQPEDVKAFFQPIHILEVHLCRRDGRPTGEAYVVLPSSEDGKKCCSELDKKYLGSRYIEVFESSAADLRGVLKLMEDRSLQGFVVRLRGLPFTATESDVRAFMDGVQLSEAQDCIVLEQAANGRLTGVAFIEVADEQALTLAMTRHKEIMGTRYIEVFNSSREDKLQAQQQLEALRAAQTTSHLNSTTCSKARWMRASAVPSIGHTPQLGCEILQQQEQQQLQPYTQYLQTLHMLAAVGTKASPQASQAPPPPPPSDLLSSQLALQCSMAPLQTPADWHTAAPGLMSINRLGQSRPQPAPLAGNGTTATPSTAGFGVGAEHHLASGLQQTPSYQHVVQIQQVAPGRVQSISLDAALPVAAAVQVPKGARPVLESLFYPGSLQHLLSMHAGMSTVRLSAASGQVGQPRSLETAGHSYNMHLLTTSELAQRSLQPLMQQQVQPHVQPQLEAAHHQPQQVSGSSSHLHQLPVCFHESSRAQAATGLPYIQLRAPDMHHQQQLLSATQGPLSRGGSLESLVAPPQ